MRVRFWGVRGSVPWATSGSIGTGCNTPCIELTDEASGSVLVLDAGSGIVGLGECLSGEPRPIPILLSHYHWDHLQGLPFFAPLYTPGWQPTIWAPSLGRDRSLVEATFETPYFPVPYDRLPSRPDIQLVHAGRLLRIGPFEVVAQPLNHPGGSFAYRIRGDSGDLVYATDHEFGDATIDRALATFAADASAVILDAHFTPEELPTHKGWGHGDWAQCVDFAQSVGAGHVWLFHHKPGRLDSDLKTIEAEARLLFHTADAASEGDSFIV